MKTLLVGYDLNSPGQNYSDLIERLERFRYWHHLDSTWLVRTQMSATELRDDLRRLIDSGDELLVVDVTGRGWAGTGFSSYDWLKNNI